MGAGVTAAVNVFSARMPKAPWTVAIAVLMSYFFLFNPTFARKATKSRFWNVVRNQGVVPVSYTHLDVYKRQVLACSMFCFWYARAKPSAYARPVGAGATGIKAVKPQSTSTSFRQVMAAP